MRSIQVAARRLRVLADTPWLLLALSVIALCYPLGAVFVWLSVAALMILLCVGSASSLGTAYIFFFLYDNMLAFPLLGGSLVRLLQIGILARAALCLLRKEAPVDRFAILAALFTAIPCGISFLLKGLVGDSLSFGINMLVLLALRAVAMGHCRSEQLQGGMTALLRRWMRAYVASAVVAVLFGVLYNRFYLLYEGVSIRFLGTHEPNFMAMFLDLAIVMWLILPSQTTRFVGLWDTLVLGVLLGGLSMTGSLTGLGIAACMLIACAWWLIQRQREPSTRHIRLARLGVRLVCGFAVAAVVSLGGLQLARMHPQRIGDIYALQESTGVAAAETPAYIGEQEYEALRAAGQPIGPHLLTASEWRAFREANGIKPIDPKIEECEPQLQDAFAQTLRRIPAIGGRLYTTLGLLRTYGPDLATSGRWGLITEKLRDFSDEPWWQKLIGRGPDPETTYFRMFHSFGYSHNSYLDFLTGFGVVGTLGALWWFVRTARRGRFFGLTICANADHPHDVATRAALTLVRVALLLHAATLSMYLNRVFLFFFIG